MEVRNNSILKKNLSCGLKYKYFILQNYNLKTRTIQLMLYVTGVHERDARASRESIFRRLLINVNCSILYTSPFI